MLGRSMRGPLCRAGRALLCVVLSMLAASAWPAEWQTLTFGEDLERGIEELSSFCLLHDVASEDVLWANDCAVEDIVPGTRLYLPTSRSDLLSIWQNRGAWKPKALVKTTSTAVAERARGTSGTPPKMPEPSPAASIDRGPTERPASTDVVPRASASVDARTPRAAPQRRAAPKDAGPTTPSRPLPSSHASLAPPVASGDARADPILLLSPEGGDGSGPMRLIVSGDTVAVVRLPKSAAPRTPSLADLDPRFDISLIPGPLPPGEDFGPRGTKMLWPVDGVVSSGFGKRGSRVHQGIDIPMPPGTPIRAARDGVVAAVGSDRTPGYRGYGNFVLVDHGRGVKTLYAHCQKVLVKKGQRIRQGHVVATVGRTGHASTDHLHFEVRIEGRPVDPTPYLPQRQKAATKK